MVPIFVFFFDDKLFFYLSPTIGGFLKFEIYFGLSLMSIIVMVVMFRRFIESKLFFNFYLIIESLGRLIKSLGRLIESLGRLVESLRRLVESLRRLIESIGLSDCFLYLKFCFGRLIKSIWIDMVVMVIIVIVINSYSFFYFYFSLLSGWLIESIILSSFWHLYSFRHFQSSELLRYLNTFRSFWLSSRGLIKTIIIYIIIILELNCFLNLYFLFGRLVESIIVRDSFLNFKSFFNLNLSSRGLVKLLLLLRRLVESRRLVKSCRLIESRRLVEAPSCGIYGSRSDFFFHYDNSLLRLSCSKSTRIVIEFFLFSHLNFNFSPVLSFFYSYLFLHNDYFFLRRLIEGRRLVLGRSLRGEIILLGIVIGNLFFHGKLFSSIFFRNR